MPTGRIRSLEPLKTEERERIIHCVSFLRRQLKQRKLNSPFSLNSAAFQPNPDPRLLLSLLWDATSCNHDSKAGLGALLLTGQKSSNPALSHLQTATEVTALRSLQNGLHTICLEDSLAPVFKDSTSSLDCNHFYLIFCPARKFWLLSYSLEAISLAALRDSGQRLSSLTKTLYLSESRP